MSDETRIIDGTDAAIRVFHDEEGPYGLFRIDLTEEQLAQLRDGKVLARSINLHEYTVVVGLVPR